MGHRPVIRVGVGGWTYAPWRETFFPKGLPHRSELEFASRAFSSVEVNGTYYGAQKPDSFARWHDETPDDFVFALKAPRFATNRRVLAEAGASIERFFASGVLRLAAKLGPINWQFMPTKAFDPDDFTAFLKLLPKSIEGRPIRHAVEVRHASFDTPDFTALAGAHEVAVVVAGDSDYPRIETRTAPFTYARIMGTAEHEPCGYSAQAIETWARTAQGWAGTKGRRDVFLYVIGGWKQANPAAAMALRARI